MHSDASVRSYQLALKPLRIHVIMIPRNELADRTVQEGEAEDFDSVLFNEHPEALRILQLWTAKTDFALAEAGADGLGIDDHLCTPAFTSEYSF